MRKKLLFQYQRKKVQTLDMMYRYLLLVVLLDSLSSPQSDVEPLTSIPTLTYLRYCHHLTFAFLCLSLLPSLPPSLLFFSLPPFPLLLPLSLLPSLLPSSYFSPFTPSCFSPSLPLLSSSFSSFFPFPLLPPSLSPSLRLPLSLSPPPSLPPPSPSACQINIRLINQIVSS